MKTNMNSKNYFSILLASALALCGNAAWGAKAQVDTTMVELEKIFDTVNTGTVVEQMTNEVGEVIGHKVILAKDYGPLALSNDFGAVTIDLNGCTIKGTNGVDGTATTAGGNGGAAITVSGECGGNFGQTMITVKDDSPVQLWEGGPYFAKCNVGATKPEESGYYFWWGDTVGYTNSGSAWVSVKDGTTTISFDENSSPANSTWNRSVETLFSEGWIDENGNLVATNDAARAHLGGTWRMPTKADLDALVENCTTVWTNNWEGTGKQGRIVKGKGAYASKSIFLPVAGFGDGSSLCYSGSDGNYWPSTPDSDSMYAWSLYFGESDFGVYCSYRYYGFSVRAVRDSADAGRPAPGSAAAIVGGKGGNGNPVGQGSEAIVDGSGEKVAVTDPEGLVKKGEDGLPYVAQIVTDNGVTTNLFTSVQAAFDSDFTADQSVTNTVTLLRDYTETGVVDMSTRGGSTSVYRGSTVLGNDSDTNPDRRVVRLDLNGHTFAGGSVDPEIVTPALIVGYGTVLIVDDSSDAQTGAIRRFVQSEQLNVAQQGLRGQAYVNLPAFSTVTLEGCNFTLKKGTIAAGKAVHDGVAVGGGIGGVMSMVTIAGGTVEGCNEALDHAFGIYNMMCRLAITGGKVKDAIVDVNGMGVSISGGLFGTEDVKNNPAWLAEGATCEANTDPVTLDEGYNWRVSTPVPGSSANPWKVGEEGSEDTVQAYTNGNGKVIVTGEGTPKEFGENEEPWFGAVPPITKIEVPTGRVDEFVKKWPWLANEITDGTDLRIDTVDFTVMRNANGTFLIRPLAPTSGSEWLLATFSAAEANKGVSTLDSLVETQSESEMVALAQMVGIDRRSDKTEVNISDIEAKGATVICPAALESGCITLPAGTECFELLRVNKIDDDLCRVTSVGGVKELSQLVADEAVANQAGLPVLIASGCAITDCNRAEGRVDVSLAAVGGGSAALPYDYSVVFHMVAEAGGKTVTRSETRVFDEVLGLGKSSRGGEVTLDFPEITGQDITSLAVTVRVEGRQPTSASSMVNLFGGTEEEANAAIAAFCADPNPEEWLKATLEGIKGDEDPAVIARVGRDFAYVLTAIVKDALVCGNIDIEKCCLRSDIIFKCLQKLIVASEAGADDLLRTALAVYPGVVDVIKSATADTEYEKDWSALIRSERSQLSLREQLDQLYVAMDYNDAERTAALCEFDKWIADASLDAKGFMDTADSAEGVSASEGYYAFNATVCSLWLTLDSALMSGDREVFGALLRSDIIFNALADMYEVAETKKGPDILSVVLEFQPRIKDELEKCLDERRDTTELMAKQYARLRAVERANLLLTPALAAEIAELNGETADDVERAFAAWLADTGIDKDGPDKWIEKAFMKASYNLTVATDRRQALDILYILAGVSDALRQSGDTVVIGAFRSCDSFLNALNEAKREWSATDSDELNGLLQTLGKMLVSGAFDPICKASTELASSAEIFAAVRKMMRTHAVAQLRFVSSEGSPAVPWKIGPDGSATPTAYTNQTGELVIEGEGQVVKTPWADGKDGITEITITDPGTELPEGAFDGMGGDDDKIKLNLPDNWQGELPDEEGNWYGAKVEIETWPLMIRNVRFQQRYPWNGLVDVYADVYGPETIGVALYVSARDGEEGLRVENYNGDREVDLTNGLTQVHIVWDADEDIDWSGFHSENVTVCVSTREEGGDDIHAMPAVVYMPIWSGKQTFSSFLKDYDVAVSNVVFDWSKVEAGSTVNISYILDDSFPGEHKIGLYSISGTPLPSLQKSYHAKEGVPLADDSTWYQLDLTADDLSLLAKEGGLAVNGAHMTVFSVALRGPLPSEPVEPEVAQIQAAAEAGRIDLRRPIIVAPREKDEIAYSQTEWGGTSAGLRFNLRFGRFGEETPILSTNLTGEGLMDFTYPERSGVYEFSYRIYAGGARSSLKHAKNPQVIVAWYIGEDDPKSVYAYDRGDGEIIINGEGYMQDFDGCGPWGTDITGVTINDGVHNVGANAFKGCTQMTHAELPASMDVIGDGAFAGDTGLETIRSDAWEPPYFNGDPFAGVEKDRVTVYIPDDNYVYDQYAWYSDWTPFWIRNQNVGEEFYFEVYSYEGVSRKVTVDGEVLYEGADYFDGWISYGSKVEVSATITDDSYLFDDGSTEKTFTWNFLNHEASIEREIAPYGADWITLQLALAGTPPDDLRDALTYANVDGTNVVTLLRGIAACTSYDRTLIVTNAVVLDLAGQYVRHIAYDMGGVFGVGAQYFSVSRQYVAPGWFKIVDSVGGGVITKSANLPKKEESESREKKQALTATALGFNPNISYDQAGGIVVLSGSTCIMEGGAITGGRSGTWADSVFNEGTFVLKGGEINNGGNTLVVKLAASADAEAQASAYPEILNTLGSKLVITGGKVKGVIVNEAINASTFGETVPEPVVEISGGYFGPDVQLQRAWIVEGYEAVPDAEFSGYTKKVIQTPPEVAEARTNALEAIEEAAGLPMTRSDEMDALVEEAKEAILTAYPKSRVETVLAEYLAKVVDQYAKDNPGLPQTLTATGTLDLRSRRELDYGEDTVEGITYSSSTWGWNETPGAVKITQKNLETAETMTVVEEQWGSSEGTAMKLIGQNTEETGLGHKLFHTVRGTVLESFVTFFFDGFERGCPSNPWDNGEPNVIVYIDPGDPDGEPPTGPTLVIEGEGVLDPNGDGVPWDKRRGEITEIFVASGVVLKTSALAGYPNLQRIIFEDPNYRLPREAMYAYEYIAEGNYWNMFWPSDGVYVEQFNGRQKVTAFYDTDGHHVDGFYEAWDNGYNPILFSTVPRDLIDNFPAPSTIEPITDENGDLTGWKITLKDDMTGPVFMPDNLGFVVLDLNGHNITGRDGYYESMRTRDGEAAIIIENGGEDDEPLVLEIIDSNPDETPDVVGGKGLDGAPAGNGAPAIRINPDVQEGTKVIVGPNVTAKGGDAGAGLGSGEEAGEPAPGAIPEDRAETVEGGKIEDGDAAESGVTAWATSALGTTPPAEWLKNLPQGVSYVGGEFWLWRRTKDGYATFDFGELPLALFASSGITSLDISFVQDEIEVDTIKAPVNFGFRFIGYTRGRKIVKTAEKADGGRDPNPVVIFGDTVLKSVSGKSIFEIVGEYDTESQQQVIIGPVKPIVVVRAGLDAATDVAAPAAEQATLAEDAGKPVIVWENLTFTSAERYATERWGGAIRMEGGAMEVVNCTFEDCTADNYGGAIFAFGLERDSSITGCRFTRCFVADTYGYAGAIYASSRVVGHAEPGAGVRFAVCDSTFEYNEAVHGGAICTMRQANREDLINEQPIELDVLRTSFHENRADGDGGAIFAEGPVTILEWVELEGQRAIAKDSPVVLAGATSFDSNFAGGSGGAIAMNCVQGDWYVPAKLSVGAGASFVQNVASNAFEYALGGAIAYLQPGGELEIFGAKFLGNTAISTGFNANYSYALGGAVFADGFTTTTFEKTRFFGNWAVSDGAYAYGGAAEFPSNAVATVTACSFDDNGAAGYTDFYGGALDFGNEVRADIRNSTFRGSNIEAVNAYEAQLTFTNCVMVGNATLNEVEGEGVYSDVYTAGSELDVAWSAYGTCYFNDADFEPQDLPVDDAANHNLPESTVAIYDPDPRAEPWLCPTGYVAAAALGLEQDATDIDSVPYGSRFWGYSMGAYECHTMRDMNVGIVVTVDPEEYAWTGLPIEPHSPKVNVYDTILGSNLVEGVDYTLAWANNVDPTDRAVVTAVGTERDYIFTSFTNFWITAYYVDYYLDEEEDPYYTEMFGELSHTNVTAKINPPKGYAYDPITSMPTGTVRRYDGECPYAHNGQLTLIVHYCKDESDDEVPDIYQKKMVLKVVNGWWNGELNGADKIYWVTLYDEEGKWAVDGTGRLGENPTNRAETVVLPTAGERPFTDYSASGNWWFLSGSTLMEKLDPNTPENLEVTSGSWPFVIFIYDRKQTGGGRGGRGGRGAAGAEALADYRLRAGLKITKFTYEDGKAAGEARASVVDESTGQTLVDELLRRTKVDVLATSSLEKGEWNVIGSPTTDGEGGWDASENSATETSVQELPAQMFYKLQLK